MYIEKKDKMPKSLLQKNHPWLNRPENLAKQTASFRNEWNDGGQCDNYTFSTGSIVCRAVVSLPSNFHSIRVTVQSIRSVLLIDSDWRMAGASVCATKDTNLQILNIIIIDTRARLNLSMAFRVKN